MEEETIRLMLTEDEADTLHRLLGKHIFGRGKHYDNTCNIYHALSDCLGESCNKEPLPMYGQRTVELVDGD